MVTDANWTGYQLIDSGGGEKLENIAGYTVVRPDPRIIWKKLAPFDLWQKADAVYLRSTTTQGHWKIKVPQPQKWTITYHELTFNLRPTEFKHIGIFPEQTVNWDWITETVNRESPAVNRNLKILNLFAYTGGATMAAAKAGAQVTHVDSVKSSVDWAGENVRSSGLGGKTIRWIVDDAYKFVLREGKRGHKYDGIIMDPPRFGRGAKGEVWKLADDLPKMLAGVKEVLADNLKFFLINAYTADISPITLENALRDIIPDGGRLDSGELAIRETYGKRLIPSGIFARWTP